jgi:hypothetical protein
MIPGSLINVYALAFYKVVDQDRMVTLSNDGTLTVRNAYGSIILEKETALGSNPYLQKSLVPVVNSVSQLLILSISSCVYLFDLRNLDALYELRNSGLIFLGSFKW